MKVLARLALLIAAIAVSPALAQPAPIAGTVTLDARTASVETPLSLRIAVQAGKESLFKPEGSHCIGYRDSRPAIRVNYRGGAMALEISATSDGDVTLFVEGPDGYLRCSDDTADSLNPAVTYATPLDGAYTIWVGVPSTDVARPASLSVATTAPDGETRTAQALFEAGHAAYKRGTIPDLLDSVRLLRLAVNRNHKEAEDSLIGAAEYLTNQAILMVDNGTGTAADALPLFTAANQTAVLPLQVTGARISLANVSRRLGDYASSVRWYWLVASKNVPDAQFRLGLAYQSGEGVAQNIDTAMYWYARAADQGNYLAQYSLGALYFEAKGDKARGLTLFRQAAEQGHVDALYALGVLSLDGDGLPKDETAAAYWLSLASEKGHPDAQYELGLLYETGRGVQRNLTEAARLFDSAASLGNAKAAEALARVRASG